MKRKLLIAILSLTMIFTLSLSVLTACGKPEDGKTHEHTFASEWSKDETNHWHATTCEHKTEKKGVEAHKFGDWKETKAATATEKGQKQRACSVCEYAEKQDIPALGTQKNEIKLADGVKLGKTYDKQAIVLTKEMFAYEGNGAITFEYKAKDAAVFTEDAPFVAGEYVVKVSVAATPEYEATEAAFDFSIEKVRLASIEKALEVTYDGATTEFDLTDKITEKVKNDDVRLVVKMNDFTVGSTVKEVEFSGNDKDNYVYDAKKFSVVVGKAMINLGHDEFTSSLKSGVWQTVFPLSRDQGVVVKGSTLEDVSIEILKDNEWADRKTFSLYTEKATKARNIERVKLVGADAGNYDFECTETSNLDASLYCKINETKITGTLDKTNDYNWGGITIENITFADKEFLIAGEQDELTEKLIDAENNFKQLRFEAYVTGTSTVIASGTRILWQEDPVDWLFTGCDFITNDGGPADIRFYLISGVEGYTDAQGYWIYETAKTLGITLKVTEETHGVEVNDTLFKNDTFAQNGYVIAKYTHTGEDSGSIGFILSADATGTVDIKVFGFVEKNGKKVFDEVKITSSNDYSVDEGETYYIRIYVTKAGKGNLTLVAYC